MTDWIFGRWRTLAEALGVRRYVIAGSASAVSGAIILALGISATAKWALFAAALFALLFWFTLDYAHRQRLSKMPAMTITPRVVSAVTAYGSQGSTRRIGADSKWVQLRVESLTDAPLIDCEAYLLSATRLDDGAVILSSSVGCTWGNMPADVRAVRLTLPAKVPREANIFSAYTEPVDALRVETLPSKTGFSRDIVRHGTYRLEVAVTAKDVPTERRTLLFRNFGFHDLSLEAEGS